MTNESTNTPATEDGSPRCAVASGSALWIKLPTNSGAYWRRVTLRDGLIYSTRIQNVVGVFGQLYYADENWNFTIPITETDLVTWHGPLIAPPNPSDEPRARKDRA